MSSCTLDSQDQRKEIIRREVERQLLGLHNQPYRIEGKQNFIVSVIFAIIIYLINDFDRPPQATQLILQQSRQLEIVFQTTIMKQKVKYIDNIQDYLPWYLLYSKKSAKVQFEFIFHIGYKPQFSQIHFNESSGNIWWQGSQIRIIHEQYNYRVIEEENGFFNSWTAMNFEYIKGTRAEQIKQFAKQQTLNKIQNQNKLSSIQDRVKKTILSMISNKNQKSLSSKMLTYIDETVNSILFKTQDKIQNQTINKIQNQAIQSNSQSNQSDQNFQDHQDQSDLIELQENQKHSLDLIALQEYQKHSSGLIDLQEYQKHSLQYQKALFAGFNKKIASKQSKQNVQKLSNQQFKDQIVNKNDNKQYMGQINNNKEKLKEENQRQPLNKQTIETSNHGDSSTNKKLQDKYNKLKQKINN